MKHWVLAAAFATCALGAAPAGATGTGASRVWVSGHGADAAGCGAPTAPCRSLQYALDNAVAAGGEIDILDPAGYGAISISKSISIVNDGVGTAGVQAAPDGIAVDINVGATDSVYLQGLDLDGVQQSGWFGILLGGTGGGRLTVVNCVVRNFLQGGVYVGLASGNVNFLLKNDLLIGSGGGGLIVSIGASSGSIDGVVDHVTSTDNFYGMNLEGTGETGALNLNVSNSVFSGNTQRGVDIDFASPGAIVAIDTTHISDNAAAGLVVRAQSIVHLSSSYIDGNAGAGIDNLPTGGGATYSSQDNHIYGNAGGIVTGASLLTDALH